MLVQHQSDAQWITMLDVYVKAIRKISQDTTENLARP